MAKTGWILGLLLEVPSWEERCGDDAIGVVFKFEVLEVLSGDVADGEILVILPCPELKGEEFFARGGRYRVEVTDDLTATGEYRVESSYAIDELPVFWGLVIERIEGDQPVEGGSLPTGSSLSN